MLCIMCVGKERLRWTSLCHKVRQQRTISTHTYIYVYSFSALTYTHTYIYKHGITLWPHYRFAMHLCVDYASQRDVIYAFIEPYSSICMHICVAAIWRKCKCHFLKWRMRISLIGKHKGSGMLSRYLWIRIQGETNKNGNSSNLFAC